MMKRGLPLAAVGMLVLFFGCAKGTKDHSPVIAKVGKEKITETSFGDAIRSMARDEAKAKAFLSEASQREQRNQMLEKMVESHQVIALGQAHGLDKDPGIRVQVNGMIASVYAQALAERRLSKTPPTDAELKAFYDDLLAQRKAEGQEKDVPPFEQVKAQLPMLYQQRQQQKVLEQLMKEAQDKTPVTIAEGWKAKGIPLPRK